MRGNRRSGVRHRAGLAVAMVTLLLLSGCLGLFEKEDSIRSGPTRVTVKAPLAFQFVTARDVTLGDAPIFKGASGPIWQRTNPMLRVPVDAQVQMVIRNGDGQAHSFGIVDREGGTQAGWTANLTGFGNETALSWHADAAGVYEYACRWMETMRGFLLVEPAGERLGFVPPRANTTTTTGTSGLSLGGSFEITNALAVEAVRITVASDNKPPIGTEDEPVALAQPASRAQTTMVRDSWLLQVSLRETSPGSLAGGDYLASLEWSGAQTGEIFVSKGSGADGALGVVLKFDLGPKIPDSASYVLYVEPWPPVWSGSGGASGGGGSSGPVTYRVISKTEGYSLWIGVDEFEGVTNPTFRLAVRQRLTFEVEEGVGDTEAHNVAILDPSGKLLTRWSKDIVVAGDKANITWTPTTPGTYVYICKYHDKTQKGSIVVS